MRRILFDRSGQRRVGVQYAARRPRNAKIVAMIRRTEPQGNKLPILDLLTNSYLIDGVGVWIYEHVGEQEAI